MTMDINKFFPSSKIELIESALSFHFNMGKSVAHIISKLITFNGHLPTGGPASTAISFWAYKTTFDDIFETAKLQGITMTLFVDDLTFSSDKPIKKSFPAYVSRRLKKVGLSTNESKTHYFSPNETRTITGVEISKNNIIKPSKKLREYIANESKKISTEKAHPNSSKIIEILGLKKTKKLFGKLQAYRQIRPNGYDSLNNTLLPIIKEISYKENARSKKRNKSK